MRKLFWCWAAGGVFAATGWYLGHQAGCCEGMALQSVNSASTANVVKPLFEMSSYTVNGQPCSTPTTAPSGPAPIVIHEEEPPVAEVCEARTGVAVMPDASGATAIVPPAIIDTVTPVKTEEPQTPPCPMVMPYCTDDDVPEASAPRMRYADEGVTQAPGIPPLYSEWEELPMPTTEAGSAEEAEPVHFEHFPGCPYARPCPKTPSKSGGTGETSEPVLPKKHKTRYHSTSDDATRQQGIDTMEYRRSDGGLNEYGPGPF